MSNKPEPQTEQAPSRRSTVKVTVRSAENFIVNTVCYVPNPNPAVSQDSHAVAIKRVQVEFARVESALKRARDSAESLRTVAPIEQLIEKVVNAREAVLTCN